MNKLEKINLVMNQMKNYYNAYDGFHDKEARIINEALEKLNELKIEYEKENAQTD